MILPRTSTNRRDRGWLRLLSSVDLAAPAGLQFRGQLLTPGAEFNPTELPDPAVILEYAGSARVSAARSRYSFEGLWLLWQFDFARQEWLEIVRTTSRDSSWTLDFAPIAQRHLHPQPHHHAEMRAGPISERIAAAIAAELEPLARELRCYVLAGLDRFVADEIVRVSADLGVWRTSSGSYPRIGMQSAGSAGSLGEFSPRIHW